jgi:hypothetical protein
MKCRVRLSLLAGLAALLAFASFAPAPPPFPRPRPPVFRPPVVRPPVIQPRVFQPRPQPHVQVPNPWAPRVRPADLARQSIQRTLPTHPHLALNALRRDRAILDQQVRVILTWQAVKTLSNDVQRTITPRVALDKVRQARQGQNRLDEGAEQVLQALEVQLSERLLREALDAIVKLAQRKQWPEAGGKAEALLQQGPLPASVKPPLTEVVRVGKQIDSLNALDSALASARQGRHTQAVLLLGRVPPGTVPADLRAPLENLRGLEELLGVAGDNWLKTPDVARIKLNVAVLREVSGDADLAARALQDLAARAFLEGYPDAAAALFPDAGSPRHAADLVRDLNVLARGEGEVQTWAARRLVSRGGQDRLPPALRPLLPRERKGAWSSRLRPSATGETAPLEKAADLEKTLREQVAAGAGNQRKTTEAQADQVLASVRSVHQDLVRQDQDDEKLFEELRKALNRPLLAGEQALARQLRRQGKTADAIRAALTSINLAAR